jgi:hypothetical protein
MRIDGAWKHYGMATEGTCGKEMLGGIGYYFDDFG